MKRYTLYILSLACLLGTGCSDDSNNTPAFEVSQSDIKDVSYEGTELSIDVTSYDGWVASTDADWCELSPAEGTGSATLKVKVEGNVDQARSATIVIRTQKETREIKVAQQALPSGVEYEYKLPIVFHVIYADAANKQQNVPAERINELLEDVNARYRGEGHDNVDMKVQFVPATEDPDGNPMKEPGIDRIKYVTSTFDISDFMYNNERKYNHFLWDPNKYVNIMVYTFTSTYQNVMGVATFPYSPTDNPMPGTESISYSYITLDNLKYAYCVSVNNSWITDRVTTGDNMSILEARQTDIGNTVAHELGHYLGLRHAFSESQTSSCADTDYCEDTPSYNKDDYEAGLSSFYEQWQKDPSFRTEANFLTLFDRQDCSNRKFTTRNVMDYMYNYSDQFTADQRVRVRHVLMYSPLIPGPKKGRSTTRTVAPQGTIDLPISVSMCPPHQ